MYKMKAKNDLGVRDLFDQRTNYSYLAYSPGHYPSLVSTETILPPGTSDFWWRERGFYGKVSSNFLSEPIEPYEPYLMSLSTKGSSVKVMHFVADAFKDFKKTFLLDIRYGNKNLLADDEMLSDITPSKGYQSISKLYRNYQERVLDLFLRHITTKDISKDILNIEDFLKELTHYIMNLHNGPFTRSAFVLSRHVSPMVSGLCIDLQDLPYSEDEKKIEFIDSPNFKHYNRLASAHGFVIDKNVPWRLVAHLDSAEMLGYAQAYDPEVASVDDIINKFYVQTAIDELETLKIYLVSMYNKFVIDNPFSRRVGHSHSTTTTHVERRSTITMEDLNSCYSDCRWLELYIKVRNLETGLNYSAPAEEAITRVAKDIEKTFDIKEAMSYIKIKFSGVDFYEGSLRHEMERYRQSSSGAGSNSPIETVRAAARRDRKIFF